jgi:ketosteroid isomerase-like protein
VTTSGASFYEQQIRLLQARDADRLVEAQYADDATLVSFQNVIRGSDALKEYFRGYLDQLGNLELISTDNFQESGDFIFFEATVKTARGTVRVYDAMVLRDGKIAYHFTGVAGPA